MQGACSIEGHVVVCKLNTKCGVGAYTLWHMILVVVCVAEDIKVEA